MRNYRAAIGDTVRGLHTQYLLNTSWTNSIAAIWAKVANSDLIPDDSGLAGADHTMVKTDFNAILTWTSNLLAAIYGAGGDSIKAGSLALEAAWPGAWPGLSTTTNKAEIGAVQAGAGAGGTDTLEVRAGIG